MGCGFRWNGVSTEDRDGAGDTASLYKIEEDGKRTIEPNPTVQIIGRPDLQVTTTGKLQISKKDLTKMVNGAANLLELFLHGFMQERKEIETANSREN